MTTTDRSRGYGLALEGDASPLVKSFRPTDLL